MLFHNTDSLRARLFEDPQWLGYPHDGYALVALREYLKVRPKQKSSTSSLAASYQSMLTFGLLEAVIEMPVAEDMLVRRDQSGKLVMHTSRLTEIIGNWLSRLEQTQPLSLEPWYNRAYATLRSAHSLMVLFSTKGFCYFQPLGDEIPSMLFFIAIIAEGLVNAHAQMAIEIHKINKEFRMPTEGFYWSMIWMPPIREALRGRLLTDGWCPFTIEHLVNSVSVSSLRYVCNQGPMNDGKNHSDCTPQSCMAYYVDIETYVPKHSSQCRSVTGFSETCEHCRPALQQVLDYLESGHMPIVTLGTYSLQIHKSTDMPYVALSHVWADGLGSTSDDGLPVCQVQQLNALVSKLRPGAAFWIDSICVPKANLARKKAIGMMAKTYQDAEAVLVLDRSLQLLRSTESLGRKLLGVLTSGWMRRLWTLQEGALAKQLYIQFADTSTELGDLIPKVSDMALESYQTDLCAELFRLMKRSGYGTYTIGDVARSLRWRDTTRATDETLAIASLLDIKVSPFLELSAEERMILLFKELHNFPKNVLFLGGSKLDIPGFRWIPKSLMAARNGNRGGLEIASQGTDATYTPKGLKSVYYALIFPERTIERGKAWMIRDKKSNRLYRVLELPDSEGTSYQCSMILTMTSIPPGGARPCVTVVGEKGPPELSPDGSFTVTCTYKRREILADVVKDDTEETIIGNVVDTTVSGMLQVCVG